MPGASGIRRAGRGIEHRLRVLHIIQNLNYGGMERLLADIVRNVDDSVFESHVLVLQYPGRFADELKGKVTVHQAPPMSGLSLLRPVALTREIRRIAPDVVHSHSGVWYKASLASRRAAISRFVHTEHGRQAPDPWVARFIDGLACRRTHVVAAVSRSVAESLERDVVRGRCEIRLILNGVDTDLFAPRPASPALRSELGIPAEAPILGSIGRLEPIKGYSTMIEAFAALVERNRSPGPPHLVIAGDGSQREALHQRVEDLGLVGRVHLPGWRNDVHDLLAAFTVFTMSSRSEGTSVSLLEAMSSGLCPVVTRVGGNPDVLGPGLLHRMVDSGDAEALSLAWEEALTHPGRTMEDGRIARERVMEHFSIRTMVQDYERLYADRPL